MAGLVLAAGLVTLFRVPRRSPPAPVADRRAALASLPVEAVARGRAFNRALRPPGYAARAVTLLGFYALARYAGEAWWVWAALGAAALTVLLSFVFPVLIEPVFNKFAPMPDGPLRASLLALAERDGVPVRDVLVADASRRTRAVNVYVSGLGP